jgi:tetratricopeptide (TPR) repeat protein
VAWVAERKDVLSTFFALVATGAYLRVAERGGRGAHAVALGALVAGLLCKPMLVTLPFAFLLLDVWPLGRMSVGPGATSWGRLPRLVAEKLPMLAVVAAFSALTYVVQRDYGAVKGLGDMGAWERVANAILAYGTYLRQTFWPTGLAVFYPHPDGFPALRVAAVALALAALTAAAWRAAPRLPFLLVGWLWFLGTLVPVIGLVQVGLQAHADRYTYLPHIGLFAALAWGGDALRRRLRVPAWGAAVAAAAILLALVGLTRAQVAVWRDDATLFHHALAVTGPNHVAHFFLGERARARGAWEEAAEHFERSIALRATTPVVHNNLGNVRAAQGRPEEAKARYREALRLAPGYAEARSNLGALLLREGSVDEAVAELRRAAQEAPGSPAARLNLGAALLAAGEPAEALDEYREVLALAGARGDAPTAQQARRTLAGLLAAHPDPALRDGEEALRLAERALALEPAGHPVDLDHLAQAQAELGRFDRAIPLTLQALQRVPPEHADFAAGLRERLEGYREGRPYRLDPSSLGAGEAGSSM